MKQKIIQYNELLSTHLGKIEDIKKLHNRDMYYKICNNILIKYRANFSTINGFDSNLYVQYINELVDYIEKYIDPIHELSLDILLWLHYTIMKKLTTTEKIKPNLIWWLRDTSRHLIFAWLDWKTERVWMTAAKHIKKELKETIVYLNESLLSGERSMQLEAIVRFFLYNLYIIHPFDNGNGKTFFILLDILLWKYDFFPVFLKNPKFHTVLRKTIDSYSPNHDFTKLVNDFYGTMLYVYKNYQM